jgi:16S rRNA (uracil1498-N3)-methyltransferase
LPGVGATRLAGREGRHAAIVRRIAAGELIELTDGAGGVALASVTAVNGPELDLVVTASQTLPAPPHRIVLVQALLKGDRSELAVELATEAGVDVIVPWSAAHCVVRWTPERAAKHLGRWRSAAEAAAKQSRRSWWPVVAELATTSEIAGLLASAALPVVLHENGTGSFADLPVPAGGDVVLVVGPEGGIAQAEVELLEAPTYRLGDNVFRGSSAGAFATAALAPRLGRWS